MLSVGELTDRKNQIVVLKALASIKSYNPGLFRRLRYIIVGVGPNRDAYEKFIESHGLEKNVKMIGYRTDIPELLHACDLFVFPSHQEGLPVALMEALCSGIKVICSRIRGNTDLVSEGLFDENDIDMIINLIVGDMQKPYTLAHINTFVFSKERIMEIMKNIYEQIG